MPVSLEETSVHPKLRDILDSLLAVLTTPIGQGLATAGQEISSVINGVANTGGSLINSAFGGLNPGHNTQHDDPALDSLDLNTQPINMQQEELDVLEALADLLMFDQQQILKDQGISHDEMPAEDDVPIYLMVLP